jgi:hypothetical protein
LNASSHGRLRPEFQIQLNRNFDEVIREKLQTSEGRRELLMYMTFYLEGVGRANDSDKVQAVNRKMAGRFAQILRGVLAATQPSQPEPQKKT